MDILMGLLLAVIGIAVGLSGLRLFFIALPMLGFVIGFFAAAAAVGSLLGDGFLGSFAGIIAGIIFGSFLAVISYLFWYIGALLSAGSTGALVGSGIMNGIGVETGWVVFLVAAIVAILFFAIAFALALPVYVVIVNTAFLGAGGMIAAILLISGQIERAELGYGVTWAAIEASAFWLFLWAVLFIVGLISQMRIVRAITLPEDPWTAAKPA